MRTKIASESVRLFIAAVFIACWASLSFAQTPPDVILHNAAVLTMDRAATVAEAVAIIGNRITAVGASDELLKLAGPATLKIDLKGRTVMPGLMDTHINNWNDPGPYTDPLPADDMWDMHLDWRAVKSRQDVLDQIRQLMAKNKPRPGRWLLFHNEPRTLEHSEILLNELNRYELDKVTPDNPAVLTMGLPAENMVLVNSRAIDEVWKDHGDFVKKYGRYWLGQNGQPDGHLEAPATRLVLNKYLPRGTPELMARGYKKVMEELNGQGITTIANKMLTHAVDAYKILEREKQQTVRLAYGLGWEYFGVLQNPSDLSRFRGMTGTGGDWNWVLSVAPSSNDGSGTRACTNLKRKEAFGTLDQWFPFGQCLTDDEYRGGSGRAAPISGNYFREWIMAMGANGIRLAADHVAGDRTASNLLKMIEEIRAKHGGEATKNWAFDHCTFMNPTDIPRAAKLGVMFSCAPKYLLGAAEIADSYGEPMANSYVVPVKSMIDAGATVAYESGTGSYIWEDLELLVTRKDKEGRVWGPQERVDRMVALRMATQWAADYVLRGDKLGSIEPGKLADIVAIDRDYRAIPAEQLSDIQVVLTMSDGRVVFVHDDLAAEASLRPAGALKDTMISTYKKLTARRPSAVRSGEGLR